MTISLALDGTRLLQAGLLLLPQLGHQPMIDLKRGADFPKMHQAAVLQDDAIVADIPQHPGAMARQHTDLASSDAILPALLGTGHALQVACTHPLVQQRNVVLPGCSNGKTQTHALPRRKRRSAE